MPEKNLPLSLIKSDFHSRYLKLSVKHGIKEKEKMKTVLIATEPLCPRL